MKELEVETSPYKEKHQDPSIKRIETATTQASISCSAEKDQINGLSLEDMMMMVRV